MIRSSAGVHREQRLRWSKSRWKSVYQQIRSLVVEINWKQWALTISAGSLRAFRGSLTSWQMSSTPHVWWRENVVICFSLWDQGLLFFRRDTHYFQKPDIPCDVIYWCGATVSSASEQPHNMLLPPRCFSTDWTESVLQIAKVGLVLNITAVIMAAIRSEDSSSQCKVPTYRLDFLWVV